ncbi:hypothetical protein AOQ84DRAFT_384937 [Glonium stellatum]|uniref:ATPase synthesis protein 25 n=1 Tax=Glonium stellatum TaxID=574774 RepID=A0A8E2FCJ8_9PEZI|nr:hypothetical protein AOQ84DRAFT_384937 [Glonium stellatum]
MSLSRAVTLSLRCNGCRFAIVRSFASLSGIALRFPDESPASLSTSAQGGQRAYISSSARYAGRKATNGFGEEGELIEGENGPPSSVQQETPAPWYLQVQKKPQQLDDSHPLAERQRIPDLPENPPPILQELLEHISVDLGLDDLSLLDLRHLDPPPALGSKLLMVIGSARSEKHLHVSADRFCRWLRSTYQLRPHAAGLLGRNELKLRLRRKARRLKLMANVGASETSSSIDDGIRTGWVCVTVGRIEAAESDQGDTEEREGFIGFGRRSDGVNIVVQMFTEEKRADTDLEGLWGGVLRRAAKEKEKIEEELKERQESVIPASVNTSASIEGVSNPLSRSGVVSGNQLPRVSNSQSAQQIRRLHTVGILPQPTLTNLPLTAMRLSGVPRISKRTQYAINDSAATSQVIENMAPEDKQALRFLVNELKQMPVQEAQKALGKGFNSIDTTDFLRSFHQNIPRVFPDTYHFEALVELVSYAIKIGAANYSPDHIDEIILRTHGAALPVSELMYYAAIEAYLALYNEFFRQGSKKFKLLEKCFNYMEEMEAFGYDSVTPEIALMFHRAFSPFLSYNVARTPKDEKVLKYTSKQLLRLRKFMDIFEFKPRNDDGYHELLHSYARLQDWLGFWDIWNGMARHMYPRSSDLYRTAFASIARSGDKQQCIHALQNCVPDMPREQPSVQLTAGLAEHVFNCLLVAEPKVGDEKTRGTVDAEWVKLFDQCQLALGRS